MVPLLTSLLSHTFPIYLSWVLIVLPFPKEMLCNCVSIRTAWHFECHPLFRQLTLMNGLLPKHQLFPALKCWEIEPPLPCRLPRITALWELSLYLENNLWTSPNLANTPAVLDCSGFTATISLSNSAFSPCHYSSHWERQHSGCFFGCPADELHICIRENPLPHEFSWEAVSLPTCLLDVQSSLTPRQNRKKWAAFQVWLTAGAGNN